MKRFTPYIFPLIVLAIVFFLVYRWYSMRSKPTDITNTGEGIEIENLSDTDAQSIMRGTGDFKTAQMEKGDQAPTEGMGSIRYELKDGKVRFSVTADLPKPETPYSVWVRKGGTTELTNAFALELGKGGYVGSAAVSEDLLPLEVVVSKTSNKDDAMNQVVLRGVIEKQPEASGAQSATPAAGEAK